MLFSAETSYTLNHEALNKIILLPLGATEQHGPHLAVSTDTHIVTEIARSSEKQRTNDIILCPTLPFGSSHHHKSFGGTISIAADLYTRVIIDLVSSLLESGFRRIVLLNGHGGNIIPVKQALALLSSRHDEATASNIVLATYWELAGKTFAGEPPMETPAISHACEYETSLMLHLGSDKVWMELASRAARPEQNGYIPFEDDIPYKGVTLFKQTAFISGNGSSGEPQLGTAKKGSHLFDRAVTALVSFLDSFKHWPLLEKLSK